MGMLEKLHAFKKYWIYFVLIIGLFALIASSSCSSKSSNLKPESVKEDYVGMIEMRLTDTLSQIEGVGSVSVMVTLQSSNEIIVANEEKTNQQATKDDSRTTEQTQKENKVTIVNNQPLVLTELTPKVEGVVVVADGAFDPEVKMRIIQATTALLDVQSHKVAVFTKKEAKK